MNTNKRENTATDGADKVRERFQTAVNQGGFGFQYRVLTEALDLYTSKSSDFYFEMAELPVGVRPRDTRIDFVLRRGSRFNPQGRRPLFLVAECKRSYPGVANWCFIRAPYTRKGGLANVLVLDSIHRNQSMGFYFMKATSAPLDRDDFYQIGIEVDLSAKESEPSGKQKGQIENAATQVLKGLNGFVDFIYKQDALLAEGDGCDILPVVFTTAQLWTSTAKLDTASLEKGEVGIDPAEFRRVDWLIHQYNQSPELKHAVDESIGQKSISDVIEARFSRSIAIVAPTGIRDFLHWATHIQLH